MGKAKLFKISSINTFANVYQNHNFREPILTNATGNQVDLKGLWKQQVFKNNNPLVLELACGKGDYTLALARRFPEANFIGVDAKGARIFTGAKQALEDKLHNVAFARMKIENITNFFAEQEVDEVWITFPDPFPKKPDILKRLSSSFFLPLYQKICKPSATIHFKTDDLPLFHFTKESIEQFGGTIHYYKEDIYASNLDFEVLNIKTYYEKKHLENGRTINYLNFTLPISNESR